MIREAHGIANARRVDSATVEPKGEQEVSVIDGADGSVILEKTSTSPAGLTPEQARLLARMLNASAARSEKMVAEKIEEE